MSVTVSLCVCISNTTAECSCLSTMSHRNRCWNRDRVFLHLLRVSPKSTNGTNNRLHVHLHVLVALWIINKGYGTFFGLPGSGGREGERKKERERERERRKRKREERRLSRREFFTNWQRPVSFEGMKAINAKTAANRKCKKWTASFVAAQFQFDLSPKSLVTDLNYTATWLVFNLAVQC